MDNAVAFEIKQALAEHLHPILGDPDLEIVDFSPELQSKTNLELISTEKIPYCQRIIDQIRLNELDYPMNLRDEYLRTLWAYAFQLSDRTQNYLFFRKYSQGKVLRSGSALNLFLSNGTFSKMDHDVFVLDDKVDSLTIGDHMLILQKNLFEQIFSFHEHYVSLATRTIKMIAETGLVAGLEGVSDACLSDIRKAKKLAGIAHSPILGELTAERVREVNDDWGIGLEIDEADGKVVVDRKQLWGLLRLLDDDFLRSPLTQERYEVHSKRKHRPRT